MQLADGVHCVDSDNAKEFFDNDRCVSFEEMKRDLCSIEVEYLYVPRR